MNDAVFKKKSAGTRATVKSLRTRLANFRNEMCDIGSAVTGGGTLWNITYAESTADVEDMFTLWTGVRNTKPKARVVSDVTKAMLVVENKAKEIADSINELSFSGGGMKEVNSSLKAARAEFAEIVKLAAKRSRRESDAVLGYCVDAVQVAIDQFGS
jgi:hypothetical protein